MTSTPTALVNANRSDAIARAFFDHAPHTCFILDGGGTILSVNARGAEVLGHPIEQLVGAHIDLVLPVDARCQVARDLAEAIANPGQLLCAELQNVGRAGCLAWVRQELLAPPAPDLERVVLAVWMDVSAQRAAQQALEAEQARVRALTLESTLAEERERRRLSVAVHDEIGQRLALARFELQRLAPAGAAAMGPPAAMVLIDEAIAATRALTFDLSSPVLYELGLEAALRSVCVRTSEAQGIPVTFHVEGTRRDLRSGADVVLHRAAQELLHNAVKHAHPTRLTLVLRHGPGGVVLIAEDDGQGFNAARGVASCPSGRGFGLFSLREQLGALGGTLRIDTAPGSGTRVEVAVPW